MARADNFSNNIDRYGKQLHEMSSREGSRYNSKDKSGGRTILDRYEDDYGGLPGSYDDGLVTGMGAGNPRLHNSFFEGAHN